MYYTQSDALAVFFALIIGTIAGATIAAIIEALSTHNTHHRGELTTQARRTN